MLCVLPVGISCFRVKGHKVEFTFKNSNWKMLLPLKKHYQFKSLTQMFFFLCKSPKSTVPLVPAASHIYCRSVADVFSFGAYLCRWDCRWSPALSLEFLSRPAAAYWRSPCRVTPSDTTLGEERGEIIRKETIQFHTETTKSTQLLLPDVFV